MSRVGESVPDFQALFESAPCLYLALEPDSPRFTITAVSDSYAHATMTKREEILGRGLFKVFPTNPDDPTATGVRNLVVASLERVIESRAPDTIAVQKYDIPVPDDEGGGFVERWWRSVNSPVFGPDGKVAYIIHHVEDVTDSVRLEEALVREERLAEEFEEALCRAEMRTTGIVSTASDAIIFLDKDQGITMFNDGAEDIFGYREYEVAGAPLDILIPPRYRAMHRQHVEKFTAEKVVARRMGERGAVKIVGLRKNGDEFPAEVAISKSGVGDEQMFTAVLRDITEETRIEREQRFLSEVGLVLAASLEFEETLSEIARVAVRELADLCVVDIKDRGEVRRFEVLAQDPDKTGIAETIMQIPLDQKQERMVETILKGKRPVLIERVTPEDLASWTENDESLRALRDLDVRSVAAVPLIAHSDCLGLLVLISSTRSYGPADVYLMEELARRAALSIENAQNYRAANRAIQVRDDVLSIVAHDLRNPLHTIVLAASRLRPHQGEPERRSRNPADRIERAAKRMDRIIQDLLEVRRMESGQLSIEPACVSTAEVVSNALEAQRSLVGSASLELQAALSPDLPDVWADRDRLQQVFENLIGNAVKFMEPGGRITVGAAPRDGWTVFWVADTGPGIAAEDTTHIFERLWQMRKGGHGSAGLGLPIVKGIVEAHGGRVWVESKLGEGSTFYFTIPTAPRAA